MGRPLRNDSQVGWFHVTNRGARKYDTFITDNDRQAFVNAVALQSTLKGVEIVAICLMANHYHLVAYCPIGNLSSMMQNVGADYTRHFNRAHGFNGPLNGDRFDSEVLDTDEYLLTTTRYVHRNPLEVGIDIATYPWSSYRSYLSEVPRSVGGLRLSSELPLQLAGGRPKYFAFVEQDLCTDKAIRSNGSRAYIGLRKRSAPSIDQISTAVESASGGGRLAGSGSRVASRRRHLVVMLAADRGAHSLEEIATYHGFGSTSTVYSAIRRARQRIEEDLATAEVAAKASEILKAL